jgi:Electron transfer flavoprotein domain.
MSNDIFVWIEQFNGQVAGPSWEALGAARTLSGTLGGQVVACLFGQGVEGLAKDAIATAPTKSSWPTTPPWPIFAWNRTLR